MNENCMVKAKHIISQAKHLTVFTGAGISVESGIADFRGPDGLWQKYDSRIFNIEFFAQDPVKSWLVIRDQFYSAVNQAQPNAAHWAIARMEQAGQVKAVITQNIDGLHQKAGSQLVYEYHGTARSLICLQCALVYPVEEITLAQLPPRCPQCQGVLKPNFVFFGEGIPEPTNTLAWREAEMADVFLVVGTSGVVMPACRIPARAKQRGARIIEVNITPSEYTNTITDIFLEGPATQVLAALVQAMATN